MDRVIENVIEFLVNQKIATVTLSQRKYVNRVRKLSQEFPEACQIVADNKDGSIMAHIPTRWIRINPSSTPLTDSEVEEYLCRFETARQVLKPRSNYDFCESEDN